VTYPTDGHYQATFPATTSWTLELVP